MRRVAILMPTFNEGERLQTTLARLAAYARESELRLHVFLVDDGGPRPITAAALPPDDAHFCLTAMRHPVNLGQGAALETARRKALAAGRFDAYVTMDSDGQHAPEDLRQLCGAVERGADVVFGNRFAGESNVPGARRALLFAARIFERAITGLALADAHNGYRAFSEKGLEQVSITQSRMAHATEIKQHVAKAGAKLQIAEVPVTIRYSDETLRKGQSSLGAMQILRDLIYGYVFGGSRR